MLELGRAAETLEVPTSSQRGEVELRSNSGEGAQSHERAQPLTRIASCDAIRPLPQGERWTELAERLFQSCRKTEIDAADEELVAADLVPPRLRGVGNLGHI